MDSEANAEPGNFEVKYKALEEENDKLKQAFTEVSLKKIIDRKLHFVSIFNFSRRNARSC